jgi:hypothetical protein
MEWHEATDPASGATCYYNPETDETRWEKPDEHDEGQSSTSTTAEATSTSETTSTAAEATSAIVKATGTDTEDSECSS